MTFEKLPTGYELLHKIELQEEPALRRRINMASLVIAVIMTAAALPFVPLSTLVPIHAPTLLSALRLLLLLPAIFLCSVVHEWIHSVFYAHFSGVKSEYHVTGIYLYVGSPAYFDRRSYLTALFSPVALLGVILMVLNFALPLSWFWFVYILQIVNLSGAAGDFYIMRLLSRMPDSLLIRDRGDRIEIYVRTEKAK